MGSSIRSVSVRAALAAALFLSVSATAFAQHPIDDAPTQAEFMPRFDWNMSAAFLNHPDQRFTWDTHWAGDFDLLGWPNGRASFLADYQAILGSELRPFDPYQSNYLLEASGSVFRGPTEFAGVLSHVSRHLGDRRKLQAVAENSLGLRVMRRYGNAADSIDVRGDMRKVIERAYVDYTWIGDVDIVVRHRMTRRTTVYGRGAGNMYLVDETVAGRDRQLGGRVELGVKVDGVVGGMEYFAGGEQMVDADPLDRMPRRWAFIGFRLLGR
jgi:hypothetical protein